MKKLFLHIKRLFKKFWFVIFLAFAISLLHGVGLLIIMTVISMLFFSDPVDVDAVMDEFTERELDIILSEEMDDSVSDDEYLELIVRYQSFFFPKKLDYVTTLVGSEVTDDAFIYEYELKKKLDGFSEESQKTRILQQINKQSVHVKRLVNSNRSMICRYYYRQTGETLDIVITTEELRG